VAVEVAELTQQSASKCWVQVLIKGKRRGERISKPGKETNELACEQKSRGRAWLGVCPGNPLTFSSGAVYRGWLMK